MLGAFWQTFAGKIGEQFSARVLSPALVFLAGGLLAAASGWPTGWRAALRAWGSALRQLPVAAQLSLLVATLLLLAALAILVERLTLPVLRLLEGYWPAWLREPLTRRRRDQVVAGRQRVQYLARCGGTDAEHRELQRLEAFLRRYPQPAAMLPTRVGNLLRTAEARPSERYGLDAVICWPYLWLLLDADAREEVGRARADLNGAARAWLWSAAFAVWTPWAWWALPAALLAMSASYYLRAVSTAETYGSLVEATFALYRRRLYAALHWPCPEAPDGEPARGEELTLYLWRGVAPLGLTFTGPNGSAPGPDAPPGR